MDEFKTKPILETILEKLNALEVKIDLLEAKINGRFMRLITA